MTSTTTRNTATSNGAAKTRLDLAPLSKTSGRRRLPEIAAGTLIIVVCALVALWWQASSNDPQPVLAMRSGIERGQTLTADQLQVVGIETDDSIAVLDETEAGEIIGRVARTDLAAGTIVARSQFSEGSLITGGDGVVGLSLEPGEVPSLAMSPGDVVAVVLTPAAGDPRAFDLDTVNASVLVERATVVEVTQVGVQGSVFVAIQVSEDDAARVASAASADRVRLIQVSEDR